MELRNFRGLSDSVLASLEVSNVPHLSHLNSEDFRSVGNSYYKKDQFCQAVIVYSKGLVFNPKSAVLLTNRAQTFLKMRMFGMCLQDCDRVLMLDPTSRNASLCRIKALSHLANISEITGPTEELPQLLQSIERLKKEVEGNFDFEQIYKQNLNLKQQRLYDHFDFVGPIAIQQLSPDKGRGLVAADDFTAGQLIMATKALECAFHSDKLCEHESPMDEVVQRLTDRCLIDGEALRELLKLYAGPDVELLNEGEEKEIAVDIMKDPSRRSKIEAMCERAVLFNAYGKNVPNGRVSLQSSFSFSTFSGMGLWVLASYINHDCYSNAASVVVGDVMFVRAVRDIKCGEEITQPYCVPIGNLQEREESLKRYGFTCQCRLCKFDHTQNHEKAGQRKKLLKEILALVDLVKSHRLPLKVAIKSRKLLKLGTKFRTELSYHNRFDVDLMLIWKSIGDICWKEADVETAKTAYETALLALRGEMEENVLALRSCVAEIPILRKLMELNPAAKLEIEEEIKNLLINEYGVTDLSLVCLN